ncbi:MAG: complex I subunit 4 family protein [bacterium]
MVLILNLILFVPLLGAVSLLCIPNSMYGLHRKFAFGVSLVSLVLCVPLLFGFDYSSSEFQFETIAPWLPSLGIMYLTGVDGLSLMLVVLTTLLTTLSILASFDSIQKNAREFYFFMLLLETGMIGTFIARDLFLFYIFWELMLVPMYFIIGIWGGKERIYAGIKFFLYTAFGSALLLIVIFYLYFTAVEQRGGAYSFNYENFLLLDLAPATQRWLFVAFVLAFLIKMPLFPFHTWLPYAHTEAPTAGSVLLAGVLLKTGTYAFLRFAVPIFPEAVLWFTPLLMAMSIIGIIYGAMVAMVQRDIKRLVAYSSVSHMGMLMAGILAWNVQGVEGGIIQMINHGLSTGALFLVVGMIYDRRHTREISAFGGVARSMPVFAAFFMIFTLSSIGLPGLNGFVGELLILTGLMGSSIFWAVLAATGLILGAAYMLMLYQRMMFGPIRNEDNRTLLDLNRREIFVLAPIAVLCFIIGMFPQPFISMIKPPAREIVEHIRPYMQEEPWYTQVARPQDNETPETQLQAEP